VSISYSGASYGGPESKEIRREGLRRDNRHKFKNDRRTKVEKENPQEKKTAEANQNMYRTDRGSGEERERERRV
jgi:hypothetical protein